MHSLSHVYVVFPWKNTSPGERDALATSGGTLHFRGEHTERDRQEIFLNCAALYTT